MEHKERIRTSISPSGLNLSTPDNAVEDGALGACHNLRYANGAWRNVNLFEAHDIPQGVQDEINDGAELAYIHPVSGKRIYLTRKSRTKMVDKVKYYAIDSQQVSEASAVSDGDNSPLLSFGRPIVHRVQYYLDYPLSDIGKRKVTIYSETLQGVYKKLGEVKSFDNGDISYLKSQSPIADSCIKLKTATATYLSKKDNARTNTFYFPTLSDSNPSAEKGYRSVFVKRGDGYYLFGEIVSVEDDIYTIYDDSQGVNITCSITSFGEEIVHLPNYNGLVYYNSTERGALCAVNSAVNSALKGFGYISYTDSAPIAKEDDNGQYYYINDEGEEVIFPRNAGETTEEYIARFDEHLDRGEFDQVFDEENDMNIMWSVKTFNRATSFEVEQNWNYFSSAVVNTPLPRITNVTYTPSKNKTYQEERFIDATLTAHTEDSTLNTFGSFSDDITIEHFGNALIVRDNKSRTLHHYICSDNEYETYGDGSASNLSLRVSVAQRIRSPFLTDVPMWYKATNRSAKDGSLQGRMYLGIGEAVGGKADTKPTTFSYATYSNEYLRGEFAIFVAARSEDGTELYRTPPQIVRSETLLNEDANVLMFSPMFSDLDGKGFIVSGARGNSQVGDTPEYDKHFILWHYEPLAKRFAAYSQDNVTIFEKYNNWKSRGKNYDEHIKPCLDKVKCADFYTIKLEVTSADKDVYDYAVYTTRIMPLFEASVRGDVSTNSIKIMSEPFYRIKTIDAEKKEVILTSDDFRNLEARSDLEYVPTQNAGVSFFARKGMEYNNCMHSYGVFINEPMVSQTQLYGADEGNITHLMASREYDGITYYGVYDASDMLTNGQTSLANEQPYTLSFNHSLKKVAFGVANDSGDEFYPVGEFAPDYSTYLDASIITNRVEDGFDSSELGVAKAIGYWEGEESTQKFAQSLKDASRSFRKYNPILINNLVEQKTIDMINQYPIAVPNRLQVSETNNPLANPYERSYRFGSLNNEIIAVNSAAIEMSDAKFGEFPLYVFTKEGVFAMQTGTETLYASIVPISQDVIINPNTLAIDGAVLFFTDKGLHMLSNQGSHLISAGLHDKDNRIPDWMRTCKMVYIPEYKEVMCVLHEDGESLGKAYVLSLDNKCWSQRNVPSGYMLRNDEVVGYDYTQSYDLTNESSEIGDIETILETRPIKLDAGKELKRLETLIVRFESDEPQDIEVQVLGSVDGTKWFDAPLRSVKTKTNTDVLIRRTPCSVKYLKFVVKCSNLSGDIRLLRFDTEHYLRFTRKLR